MDSSKHTLTVYIYMHAVHICTYMRQVCDKNISAKVQIIGYIRLRGKLIIIPAINMETLPISMSVKKV